MFFSLVLHIQNSVFFFFFFFVAQKFILPELIFAHETSPSLRAASSPRSPNPTSALCLTTARWCRTAVATSARRPATTSALASTRCAARRSTAPTATSHAPSASSASPSQVSTAASHAPSASSASPSQVSTAARHAPSTSSSSPSRVRLQRHHHRSVLTSPQPSLVWGCVYNVCMYILIFICFAMHCLFLALVYYCTEITWLNPWVCTRVFVSRAVQRSQPAAQRFPRVWLA